MDVLMMNCCGSQGTWQFKSHLSQPVVSNGLKFCRQHYSELTYRGFCARDEDEEEYISADESSNSDSDLEPMDIEETEYEDGMDESPAIQVGRTQVLRNRLAEGDLAPKVKYVLQAMKTVGMDVPIFLDALSWGTEECT